MALSYLSRTGTGQAFRVLRLTAALSYLITPSHSSLSIQREPHADTCRTSRGACEQLAGLLHRQEGQEAEEDARSGIERASLRVAFPTATTQLWRTGVAICGHDILPHLFVCSCSLSVCIGRNIMHHVTDRRWLESGSSHRQKVTLVTSR